MKVVGFTDAPLEVPMWNNPSLDHLNTFMDYDFWKKKGIVTFALLCDHRTLHSFEHLCEQYNISHRYVYKYLQLCHVLYYRCNLEIRSQEYRSSPFLRYHRALKG